MDKIISFLPLVLYGLVDGIESAKEGRSTVLTSEFIYRSFVLIYLNMIIYKI